MANVPVPLDVHVVVAAFVALDPVVIFIGAELEQVVSAVPETAVGAEVIVISLLSVTFEQPALPFAVNTIVLLPVDISPALGL